MGSNPPTTVAHAVGTGLCRVLLTGLAMLTLISCGGIADGEAENCSPAPRIASEPPRFATVGRQYRYDYDAAYVCLLVFIPWTCDGVDGLQLPPGAGIDQASNLVYWTPSASQANTSVTFQIATQPDSCGDRAAQTWTVSVVAAPIPSVTSTTPASGATGIAHNSHIEVIFSAVINPSTVTAETMLLQDSFGNRVPATVWSTGGRATLHPIAPLTASTTYQATVTTGVQEQFGTALAAPYSWTFTTAAN